MWCSRTELTRATRDLLAPGPGCTYNARALSAFKGDVVQRGTLLCVDTPVLGFLQVRWSSCAEGPLPRAGPAVLQVGRRAVRVPGRHTAE